jgi:hypothetical protein
LPLAQAKLFATDIIKRGFSLSGIILLRLALVVSKAIFCGPITGLRIAQKEKIS